MLRLALRAATSREIRRSRISSIVHRQLNGVQSPRPQPEQQPPLHQQHQPSSPYQVTLAELDRQLSEVKVFQDEQIIQLSFESGKSINYTMRWLRNLCSCPVCLATRGSSTPNGVTQQKLAVASIRCEPNQFVVEWLEQDEYRSHRSVYLVKHLNPGIV